MRKSSRDSSLEYLVEISERLAVFETLTLVQVSSPTVYFACLKGVSKTYGAVIQPAHILRVLCQKL